jgi:5-methyltetrahydrofolate--homocysteine methyltransferase
MDNEILSRIALCVERGKIDRNSPHPPDMKGLEGTDELTAQALESGLTPHEILSNSLIEGMKVVGERFRNNEIYLPDVLMSARAMNAAMEHLKPFFTSGNVHYKGRIILGTVAGDLHDIGKKIVGMFFEGGGWEVIDCGVDVSAPQFLQSIEDHAPDAVGLSALLPTTMVNMEEIVQRIKDRYPDIKIIVGGAPVTDNFADRIGADLYSPDPQGALDRLMGPPES